MKYNFSKLTKLIALFVIFALALSLFACENEVGEVFEATDEPDSPTLDVATAVELLKRDRIATQIFVSNALCERHDSNEYQAVPEDSQYSSYSEIERLLAATYLEGGDAEVLKSYPPVGEKSIKNNGGKTYAYYHGGSEFTDYTSEETVSVKQADSPEKAIITAKTISGREVEFNACHTADGWRLEHGIFVTLGDETTDVPFDYSRIGSLKGWSGNILVVELFLSDKSTGFDSEAEEAFHNNLVGAVDKVSEIASEYGKSATLDYKRLYFDHGAVIGSRPLDFDIIFAETGFGTLKAFVEANCDLSGYDGYFIAVCHNKSYQTAFNRYSLGDESDIYYGERIHIGSDSSEFDMVKSILSLLGASDYNELTRDEYVKQLFLSYFPDELMRSDSYEGKSLSVANAYACGFTDKIEKLYYVFK